MLDNSPISGMKTKRAFSLILVAMIAAFLGFSLPVKGNLHQALDFLEQAEKGNSSPTPDVASAAHLTELLNSALQQIENKTPAQEWTSDRREQAIAFVQSALSDLQNNDTTKANENITHAIVVLKEAMGMEVATADKQKSSATPQPAQTQVPRSRTAPIVDLTPAQSQAVVLIKGDHGEGTGFLVKTDDGPTVVTNIHVISNNPNLKILTSSGQQITTLSLKGAVDRDLAMFSIKDMNYSYLDLAADIGGTVQPGDEVVTPGNSEGGEVMLNTGGKVLGIGPDRIEFNNPIYHGNSGGPVFHTKSGKVIGVVSLGMSVIITNDLDKTSFASRNSAIAGAMRYFGLRVDNVPKWESYDWDRLQNETAFLDQFQKRNLCLDAYFNTPKSATGTNSLPWLSDDKLKKAIEDCVQQSSGSADDATRKAAVQEFLSDLNTIVETDMDTIQQVDSFYSFDQQRAKYELDYRQKLKKELDFIGNDLERLGFTIHVGK
jgi:S1-C subfamily serine protease